MAEELSTKGKAGFGLACAVCCAVPMLVLAGVVSLGAVALGGLGVGAVVLVGSMVWMLLQRRSHSAGEPAERRALADR